MKLLSGLAIVLGIGWISIEAAAVPETVQTTSGLVQGQIASGTSGVSEYLGIPFVRQ
jgi:cholinesterase